MGREQEVEKGDREALVSAEIEEMDNVISGVGLAEVQDASTDAEVAPSVDVGEQEADVGDVSAQTGEAEAAEDGALDSEDAYDFDFINEMARNAIVRQSGAIQEAASPPPTVSPSQVVPIPAAATTSGVGPTPVVTVEEMSAAFESPEKFVELIGKVYQRAVQDAKEQALLSLPQVARQVSMQVIDQATLIQKFYRDNPELENYKDFVRYCALQVEAKHPDWSYEAVAVETAKLAKSRLPLLRKAQQSSKQRPALPGSGRVGQRKAGAMQAGLNALQSEINEMPDRF